MRGARNARVQLRTPNVAVLLLTIVVVAGMRSSGATAPSPQTKPSSPPTKPSSYVEVVELYRRGEDALALKQLAMLTSNDIRIGQEKVRGALFSGNRRSAQAAVLLHTVAAFGARGNDDVLEFRYHFKLARAYIDEITSIEHRVTPFVRTWQLFVMASYHGQRGVQAARDFGRGVRDPRGDSAFLLLALGATEERQ